MRSELCFSGKHISRYASLSELRRTQKQTVWLSYGIVFCAAQYKAKLSLCCFSKIKTVFVCSAQIDEAFQKRDCWACPASPWSDHECVSVKTLILKDYCFGLMVRCFPQSVYLLVQFALKRVFMAFSSSVRILEKEFCVWTSEVVGILSPSSAAARNMSLEMTLFPFCYVSLASKLSSDQAVDQIYFQCNICISRL